MRQHLKWLALVAVLAPAAPACGGDDEGGGEGTGPTGGTGVEVQSGGTLRVWQDTDVTAAFDPHKEYFQVSFAYYRCCLLRTLLCRAGGARGAMCPTCDPPPLRTPERGGTKWNARGRALSESR